MRAFSAVIAAVSFVTLATEGYAQAYQCQIPSGRIAVPRVEQDGSARPMPVSGYTLALSWSPEFCRKAKGSMQCSGKQGRFGFIVHGLWPEGRSGKWPQWCDARRPVPEAIVRQHLCMTPSPSLMVRQWAKHGSCMTRAPDAYFNVAAILWRSLVMPDIDPLSAKQPLVAGDVRKAIIAANPSLRPDSIGIITGQKGSLKEIRLCYGKDFMPTRCDKQRLGAGTDTPVKIWRGL